MASFQFTDNVEVISSSAGSTTQKKFDCIIGVIEEIIVSDEFLLIQHDFMEKYYMQFEDTEENKFIYTDIFREYSAIIESYLVQELKKKIPHFSMEKFASSLQAHKDEITDEIFDMINTFTDFLAFKEMFLDYRADKEGKNLDLMDTVMVHSIGQNPCSSHSQMTTS